MSPPLKTILASDFDATPPTSGTDAETLATAQTIIDAVRTDGESAVRSFAEKWHERSPQEPLWYPRDELQAATARIPADDLALLERVRDRIARFAQAQLECLTPLTVDVPGGQAGHTIEPIQRAGCYAPAGRYPLPSTVLMTVATARTAGCKHVVMASPNPSDLMLAAAFVAGADEVLAIGGAHAIAVMAYGLGDHAPVDLICGPGNRFVTAAKKLVHGAVGIDMLAGPSELVIIADGNSNPETIAADLLAQAEHDVDARPFLLTPDSALTDSVNKALEQQLETLPTAETARLALGQTRGIIVESMEQAIELANRLAPEHLELHVSDPDSIAARITNAGCIFLGHDSAEVFGDYGVGPNHTLPTAGTARFSAGLNVFTFLRVRTWLKLNRAPADLVSDTARLAELEGLVGHKRAALKRRASI